MLFSKGTMLKIKGIINLISFQVKKADNKTFSEIHSSHTPKTSDDFGKNI